MEPIWASLIINIKSMTFGFPDKVTRTLRRHARVIANESPSGYAAQATIPSQVQANASMAILVLTR